MSLSCAVPVLLLLAAPPRPPVPTCDRPQLAVMMKKVAGLTPVERTNRVSMVMATACDGRLPKSVIDALDALHATELSEHGPTMLMALRDAPEFAKAGCERWEEEFSARSAPGEKLRAIFRGCAIEEVNLATEDELAQVADLGAVYAAMPLYRWFSTHGHDAAGARKLVRALLGLSGDTRPAKPEPKKAGPKKRQR